jgi:hypothetical protein
MTIIPLLNNCENVKVSASKHIFESSCPLPPYKRANASKSASVSSVLFHGLQGTKSKRFESFESVPINRNSKSSMRQKTV